MEKIQNVYYLLPFGVGALADVTRWTAQIRAGVECGHRSFLCALGSPVIHWIIGKYH